MRIKRKNNFFKIGFHGDKYLLQIVNKIINRCKYFIETGTNVGSTLVYIGRNYPFIRCLSCEPDRVAFNQAVKNASGISNVSIYNETSQNFLFRLKRQYSDLFDKRVMFWLDAHGYGFKWPLKEEIAFITKNFNAAYILIDDFKVPGLDCFVYDKYQGQECSFDYIKESINPKLTYNLYYPTYTEKTSEHHPLCGWGLIEYGHKEKLEVPDVLYDKVRCIAKNKSMKD